MITYYWIQNELSQISGGDATRAIERLYNQSFENGSYHPNEVSVNEAKQNLR